MTLRNRHRLLALAAATVTLLGLAATPAEAAAFCRGQRATVVGTRGIDFLVGTSGPDVIVGRTGLDQIYGRGGNDTICAGRGDDFVIAGEGDDFVYGETGSDELFGDEGNDYLDTGPGRSNGAAGGPGDDYLAGGTGFDIANYVDSSVAVSVDLAEDRATGEGIDTLDDIDGAYGSAFDDVLAGDPNDNLLVGAGGSDQLWAAGNSGSLGLTPTTAGFDILVGDGDPQLPSGNDTLIGGTGVNIADFSSSRAGVQVDLDAETATGDGSDRLVDIQIVAGSRFGDVLVGDAEDNAFRPFGGDDRVDGRDGMDAAVFTSARQGVTADLNTGLATGEGSDSLADVESLWGGPRADQLTGDAGINGLVGFEGGDRIAGGDGDDVLDGGRGTDSLDGGIGTDSCSRGESVFNCETQASHTRSATPKWGSSVEGWLEGDQRSARNAWINRVPELPRL